MTNLTGNLTGQALTGPGTWNATGTTIVAPVGSGTGYLDMANNATLENDGTLTLGLLGNSVGYGIIDYYSSLSPINGTSFVNASGATVSVVGGGGDIFTSLFTNAGLINVSAADGFYVNNTTFTNTGAINLQSGLLRFGPVASTGTITAASGTTIDFGGDDIFTTSSIGGTFTTLGSVFIGLNYNITLNTNVTLGQPLTNYGTIEIGQGKTLSLQQGTSTSAIPTADVPGSYKVDSGATLSLGGDLTPRYASPTVIGKSATILFTGANDTLALTSAAITPHYVISGFVSGDVIDLIGITATAATPQDSPSGTIPGSALGITNQGSSVGIFGIM